MTARINQDCLENSFSLEKPFSVTRQKGGFRDTPDTGHLMSVRAIITENLLSSSILCNCEDYEEDEILLFTSRKSLLGEEEVTLEASLEGNAQLGRVLCELNTEQDR